MAHDDQQVHVGVATCFATGMGTEQDDLLLGELADDRVGETSDVLHRGHGWIVFAPSIRSNRRPLAHEEAQDSTSWVSLKRTPNDLGKRNKTVWES